MPPNRRPRRAAFGLLVASAAVAPAAFAQTDNGFRLEPLIVYAGAPATSTSATGAASAWRGWLPSHGTEATAQVTLDLTQHRHALVPQRGVQRRVLSSVTLHADLDSTVGWRGLSASVSALSLAGADQSNTLGAANGGTSIDAVPFRGLGEAWMEQRLAQGAVRLKAGRMDGNTEFAAAANAAAFLRPGSGLDPTLAVVMPTYPVPALGVNAFVQLAHGVRIGGGLYDGQPSARAALGALDDATAQHASRNARFGIAEINIEGASGRVAVGAWRHTANFAPLLQDATTLPARGVTGVYAVADRTLMTFDAAFDDDSERTLNAFAQFGIADRRLSDVNRHASVGLTASSPFRRRADDVAGVTLSFLTVGDVGAIARGARFGARETHLELLYALQVASWLAVIPDLQVITHPVGRADGKSATAVTLRLAITP